MQELDVVWLEMLSQAEADASLSGRGDVAEYIRLRTSNDRIRMAGSKWLIGSFIELALEPALAHASLSVDRISPHTFRRSTSNMVGEAVEITNGMRCLTVEAGWTRTPSDGVMRHGALAAANIRHRGMPESSVELMLVRTPGLPEWIEAAGRRITTADLRAHIDILLGH